MTQENLVAIIVIIILKAIILTSNMLSFAFKTFLTPKDRPTKIGANNADLTNNNKSRAVGRAKLSTTKQH